MTEVRIDPAVLAFAAETALEVRHSGAGVELRETETMIRLERADVGSVVSRRFRAHEPVIEVVSDTVDGAQRVLLSAVGQAWRTERGLPVLATAIRGTPDPGVVVEHEPGVGSVVRWQGGVATHLDLASAGTLVRMIGHSVEDIVASYRDPQGRPVFPPRPTTAR